MRDQEVLRATKELAAYFKGLRTEREARSALKIIKAFIRDRERTPASVRRPLPGRKGPAAAPKRAAVRRKPRRKRTSVLEAVEPPTLETPATPTV